jgi:hypothetical protein
MSATDDGSGAAAGLEAATSQKGCSCEGRHDAAIRRQGKLAFDDGYKSSL